jgi:CheY-like chemotaxis protein
VNQTNILIIDGVEAIRDFTSLVFKRMGYAFVETAEVALKKVQLVVFDLILLDINLPKMSGLELLKHLSIKSPNSKVVMCSASSSEDDILQSIEDGAEGFLVKSVT